MMRRSVVRSVLGPVLFLAALGPAVVPANAQNPTVAVTGLDGQQRFTAEQLDNLTAPVALYPDALLAQVLVAATFPDQIQDAAAFVRANGTDGIDVQAWDISVKAVAHYSSALNSMADKIDWTTALGKAYASQSSEVMSSVQRLRALAAQQGNLKSTEQQQVVQDNGQYEIAPTQASVIYVPVYDPYIVYSQPIFNVGFRSSFWSFGVGFPIGAWLSYDCDWGLRRVYYNGWNPVYYRYAGGWRERARPYVRVTDIYVSPRYRDVYVNHNVTARYVDYRNVDRYASVHRGQHFEGRPDNRHFDGNDNRGSDRRGTDGRNDGLRGSQGSQNRDGGDRTAHQHTGDGIVGNDRVNGTNNGNNNGATNSNGTYNGGYNNGRSGDRNNGNNSVGTGRGIGTGNGVGTGAGVGTGGRVGGSDNRNGADRSDAGNGRVPPQYRRGEPAQNSNGAQIVVPPRREPPVNRDGQQVTTPPANGATVSPQTRGGNQVRDNDGRFRPSEQRRAQQQQQVQPQQQQAQPQQQQVQQQARPQQQQQPPPPRHEQQQQVHVQPPNPPQQQSAPPKHDDGRGRGSDKGRGGDDRRGH